MLVAPDTPKAYLGQTVNYERRMVGHNSRGVNRWVRQHESRSDLQFSKQLVISKTSLRQIDWKCYAKVEDIRSLHLPRFMAVADHPSCRANMHCYRWFCTRTPLQRQLLRQRWIWRPGINLRCSTGMDGSCAILLHAQRRWVCQQIPWKDPKCLHG